MVQGVCLEKNIGGSEILDKILVRDFDVQKDNSNKESFRNWFGQEIYTYEVNVKGGKNV